MQGMLKLAVCVFLVVITQARVANVVSMAQEERVNNRPIIGILTEPTFADENKYGEEYILATYVQYLESAGARVVPIRGNQPSEYYNKMFKSLNGVLFPGGGAGITSGPYFNSGKNFFDLAKQANDRGDYFPIWGTCLGLELFTVLVTGKNMLKHTNTSGLTLPLDLVGGYQQSRLFGSMSQDLITILKSEPVTQNNHQYSLLLEDFQSNEKLQQFFKLLSINVEKNYVHFISTIEAKHYPFYATQWHPEKNVFKWNPSSVVDHSFNAIRVTQYMANFFVNEARKSKHHFESSEEEAKFVIENNVRVYVPDGKFTSVYYFNNTNMSV